MKRKTFQFRAHLIFALVIFAILILFSSPYLPVSRATSPQDPNATLPSAKKPAPTTESESPAKKSVPPPKKNKPPARTTRTGIRPSPTLTRTRTNQAGIEFVLIPSGRFMMGSTNDEFDIPNHKPMHEVRINQQFYMGKYEVTQGQWHAVIGNNPSNFKGCGSNCPVEMISWNDAQYFVGKLNQANDGFAYRLPSEAEWEYACRAGTTGNYYAPDVGDIGWYEVNSGMVLHAVGGKQPNAFGLYDMSGNVGEWCEDWYHDNYNDAPSDGSAWLSGGEQKERVVRGGSWNSFAARLLSASRAGAYPQGRDATTGFRVVAVVYTSNPSFRIK